MSLVQTRGAASAQGFGEFAQAAVAANFIEDVFSTYLYTGTGASQTITNGIDLSTKGGLVWLKDRSVGAYDHKLFDTVRGATFVLSSSNTDGQFAQSGLTNFNTNGFSIGSSVTTNASGDNYASWAFREQPKFFDVVTYSGDGIAGKTVAHSLGSVPGCILVKCTSSSGTNWAVYHRSLANTEYLVLNSNAAKATGATWWNSTTPTSAVFSLGTNSTVNASGETFVAYLFAHNAGGFGLAGTDNVISCGSYTTDGSGLNSGVSLGYEPQWIMYKRTDSSSGGDWYMQDNMRGMTTDGAVQNLFANTSAAESSGTYLAPTATGFKVLFGQPDATYIYIAIRRGPMKVPTVGTSVFSPNAYAGTSSAQTQTTNFPVDLFIDTQTAAASDKKVFDRLRGTGVSFETNETNAEDSTLNIAIDSNTGVKFLASQLNGSGFNYILWAFKRAPSFMDVVCYTGTGAGTTFNHNLGAVPELIIVKRRDTTGAWDSYSSALANTEYVVLNTTAAKATGATRWNSTTPTSSVFSVGTSTTTNASAGTYVAYLFATCAGVSKVGSYTGTATTLQIDCSFTGGARFVLIKRTDSTGDWYVWDTARGIVSGNDSYLLLNSTAAEVTSTDYIDTYSAGFEISSTAPAAINANGGSFIFLAIS